MQAEFEIIDGVIVIHLKGRLSYEWADIFRANCIKHLTQLQYEKIVFNLSQLSFVGSSGISEFLDTITELSANKSSEIKFCGVTNEFQRIFQISPLKDIEIYENDKKACLSFQSSPPQEDLTNKEEFIKRPFFESSHIPQEFAKEDTKKNKL